MKRLSVILVAFVIAITTRIGQAQSFVGAGGAIAFAPQISTVSSGVVIDVQPTVSQDLKYVTFTTRAQDSQIIALHNFQVESAAISGPALGFVGNVSPVAIVATPASSSPDEIQRRAIASRSILARKGMFLLRTN